jgi:hypothetical protein
VPYALSRSGAVRTEAASVFDAAIVGAAAEQASRLERSKQPWTRKTRGWRMSTKLRNTRCSRWPTPAVAAQNEAL